MKRLLSLFILLGSSFTFALDDGIDSVEGTRALSDKIIYHFIREEFEGGLSLAKPYWPVPEVEIDALANTINAQWPVVDQRFGPLIGSEFIRSEEAGDSLIRYYYLLKFKNNVMLWEFTFYQPKRDWIVQSITFGRELDSLFKAPE